MFLKAIKIEPVTELSRVARFVKLEQKGTKTRGTRLIATDKVTYRHPRRRACAEKHKMAEKLEQALDRLECYIDVINDIEPENEDDMLCCYVSRRIHRSASKKAKTAEHLL